MQSYIYVVCDKNLYPREKLGEFDNIENALIFIQAYYDKFYGECFSLTIERKER